MSDSFSTRSQLQVGGRTYDYFSLRRLGERFDISHLPYSMKILLENLLRHEDGGATVGKDHIQAVAQWDPTAEPDTEIAFMPARVVLQDFTGVPCVVDLAASFPGHRQLGNRTLVDAVGAIGHHACCATHCPLLGRTKCGSS